MPRPPVDLADFVNRVRVLVRSAEGWCVAQPWWLDETVQQLLDVAEELSGRRATDTRNRTAKQRRDQAIRAAHEAAVKAGAPRTQIARSLASRFNVDRATIYRALEHVAPFCDTS